jgi:hypothetical protein
LHTENGIICERKNEFIYSFGQNWGERTSQSVFAFPTAVSQLIERMKQDWAPGLIPVIPATQEADTEIRRIRVRDIISTWLGMMVHAWYPCTGCVNGKITVQA